MSPHRTDQYLLLKFASRIAPLQHWETLLQDVIDLSSPVAVTLNSLSVP